MLNKNLLIEVRTEELPPKNLKNLRDNLVAGIKKGLQKQSLSHSNVIGFATPRRLAVIVEQLADRQPNQNVERRGPALAAALDENNEPSKALLGFARSCGVENIDDLEKRTSEKGTWFYFSEEKTGASVGDLIPSIIEQTIKALPIERRMRWGSSRSEFVRPVQSFILLYGNEVIPMNLLDHEAGNKTVGHRFMSEGQVVIKTADSYAATLRSHSVIVDFEERVESIRAQIGEIGRTLEANVVIDEKLLEEVAALVEWPVVLSGNFDPSFLAVPEEALISAMKEHQRYFHVTDANNKLLPRFVTVSNIESKDPNAVVKGNERVIAPRLSDAAFFFSQDKKTDLESMLPRLDQVIFQNDLGTYKQKVERISNLAGLIAGRLGANVEAATRAGMLCKSDLVTDMVNEFPDLQGLMGGYYAQYAGETNDVSEAIADHYLPIQSGGNLPRSVVGCCVSIADKLDTLTGLFGIGQPPTGSRDPFALRRQTLGVIRMCIENNFDIDIKSLVKDAAELHQKNFEADDVSSYLLDRLETWYLDQNIDASLFNAIRHSKRGVVSLAQNHSDLLALQEFSLQPAAEGLVAANKRVANILKNVDSGTLPSVNRALFEAPIEDQLYTEVEKIQSKVIETPEFTSRLALLGELQANIDQYFELVMVNCEDTETRDNRLATLLSLRQLFLSVADFSLLQL